MCKQMLAYFQPVSQNILHDFALAKIFELINF